MVGFKGTPQGDGFFFLLPHFEKHPLGPFKIFSREIWLGEHGLHVKTAQGAGILVCLLQETSQPPQRGLAEVRAAEAAVVAAVAAAVQIHSSAGPKLNR